MSLENIRDMSKPKPNESLVKSDLYLQTKEAATNTELKQFLKKNEKKILSERNERLINAKFIKSKKMGELMRKIIVEVFSKSTMHGVAKIFNTKNLFVKFMWIIFLLACAGLFAHMAILSLLNYLRHDVTTKIRTIYERPTLFPTGMPFYINYSARKEQ